MATLTHAAGSLPEWTHELEWNERRIRAFWEFAGSRPAFAHRFFAESAAPYIVRRALRVSRGPHRALDVGTGTGAVLRELVARAVPSIGIDVSSSLVRAARARQPSWGLTVLQADAGRLPFRGRCFSMVFMLELLEHLPSAVGDRVLDEAARVLRPGGTLVVTTPAVEGLNTEITICPECGAVFHRTQHLRSFDLPILDALVRRHGFHTVLAKGVDFNYLSSPLPLRMAKLLGGLVVPSNLLLIASRLRGMEGRP